MRGFINARPAATSVGFVPTREAALGPDHDTQRNVIRIEDLLEEVSQVRKAGYSVLIYRQRCRAVITCLLQAQASLWYDGAIMMTRTQVTLEGEMQRRARQRASDLGVSLAEYFRRLVARDLGSSGGGSDVRRIFDLGDSGASDIAKDKDVMIAESVHSSRRKRR